MLSFCFDLFLVVDRMLTAILGLGYFSPVFRLHSGFESGLGSYVNETHP